FGNIEHRTSNVERRINGAHAARVRFGSPSPLGGERAGVRGETSPAKNFPILLRALHPSPSFPLPSEGRGRIALQRRLQFEIPSMFDVRCSMFDVSPSFLT